MKILIVSHTYPPNPGVGGRRIEGLKKYLERLGIEVYLVVKEVNFIEDKKKTKDDPLIIRTGNLPVNKPEKKGSNSKALEFIKGTKLVKTLKEFYFLPDKEMNWFDFGYREAAKIIKEKDIDILVTSSLPHVAQFIGARLKKENPNLKWIAELRDLWSKNHYNSNNIILKRLNKKYENKTLKQTNALVTVSEPLVEELKDSYPEKKIQCITNGFDPESRCYEDLDNTFSITYTGILYEGMRDPRSFLGLIKEMMNKGLLDPSKVIINFYGPKELWLENYIVKNGMNRYVFQNGLINHKEALKKQNSSQLLLFINSNKKKDVGVYTAKIFEYLNSRRPMVAIGNCNGVVEKLLDYTNTGYYKSNIEEMENIILGLYREYLSEGKVEYKGIEDRINKYSYENMAKKYRYLIEELE